MIEIIDKINNTISKISDTEEAIRDPKGEILLLSEYSDSYKKEGKAITGIIFKEDGSILFLYNDIKKKNARDIYEYIKYQVIEKGYEKEIEWCKNIPPLDQLDKWYFFQEYCWVVINSGMKNQVAKKIFDTFWDDKNFNFEAIKHPQKYIAIKKMYDRLDFYFNQLKTSKNILKFLESLPFIGPVTKYHLARNLGLDYAKPDRHLVRIAALFEYDNVQNFCKDIADISGDKIGVVDLVFWRFANLTEDYITLIQEWRKQT